MGFFVIGLGGFGRNLAPGRRTLSPGCPPSHWTPGFQHESLAYSSAREQLYSLVFTLLLTSTLFPFCPIFLFVAMSVYMTSTCIQALLSFPITWQMCKDLKAAKPSNSPAPLPAVLTKWVPNIHTFKYMGSAVPLFPHFSPLLNSPALLCPAALHILLCPGALGKRDKDLTGRKGQGYTCWKRGWG